MLSRDSGGIVKIDWKAWTPSIYQALTGVNGWRVVERLKNNVKIIYNLGSERGNPPVLVIGILVIPHYIDYDEVYGIASYIGSISDEIPMVLLAFHPYHITSWRQMNQVIRAVKDAGIKNLYIGNEWGLGNVGTFL